MSRLTDYKEHYCFMSCYENEESKIREECPMYSVCYERKMHDKLWEYEDLEAQGRLIELPCKVGDTVWYIEKISSYTPMYHTYYRCYSFDIEYIEITENWVAFGVKGSGMLADHRFYVRDIGKTVFLTKEEAEAKLNELKGE